jgi:hypothetical protein
MSPPTPAQSKARPSHHSFVPSLSPKVSEELTSIFEKQMYQATKLSPGPEPPFTPCNFFFNGSLMDAEVLQTVLDLPSLPVYKAAFLSGFKIKMWNIQPTLVPSATYGKIQGMVWKVESAEYFSRLGEYETRAYQACKCEAELENGEILRDCIPFCWAGDPASRELSEGAFDLEMYRRYFTGPVVRN